MTLRIVCSFIAVVLLAGCNRDAGDVVIPPPAALNSAAGGGMTTSPASRLQPARSTTAMNEQDDPQGQPLHAKNVIANPSGATIQAIQPTSGADAGARGAGQPRHARELAHVEIP